VLERVRGEVASLDVTGAAVIFGSPRLAFKATATCSRYAGKLRRATTASERELEEFEFAATKQPVAKVIAEYL
jgi:hypothetical protein